MSVQRPTVTSAWGFSLVDVLLTIAAIAVASAIAVPTIQTTVDRLRLGMATRDVAGELQTARLKAVGSNAYMRVRFNCPAAGQLRVVERIGNPNAADTGDDTSTSATARCNDGTYPAQVNGADRNSLTRPNNDEPIQYLPTTVSFSTSTGLTAAPNAVIEFWPDGSVHVPGATPWPRVGTAGVSIVLQKGTQTKTITVTSLGNITMQR
jgi:Tfp pilus assembly protein FimT